MNTALEDVKNAEREADRLVEEARRQKQAIVAEGRARAAQFLKEKEDDLAGKKAQAIEKRKEKLLDAKQKLMDNGMAELKQLRKAAERRTDEAVKLVMEAFEKEMESA